MVVVLLGRGKEVVGVLIDTVTMGPAKIPSTPWKWEEQSGRGSEAHVVGSDEERRWTYLPLCPTRLPGMP